MTVFPTTPTFSNSYDWLDRLTNMVDATGTNKYSYTKGNQLWTEDGPFASDTVMNTQHDDENRLIQWAAYAINSGTPSDGDKLTDFVYDGMSRLRGVSNTITSPRPARR